MMKTIRAFDRIFVVLLKIGPSGDRLWWTTNLSGRKVYSLIGISTEGNDEATVVSLVIGPIRFGLGISRPIKVVNDHTY